MVREHFVKGSAAKYVELVVVGGFSFIVGASVFHLRCIKLLVDLSPNGTSDILLENLNISG